MKVVEHDREEVEQALRSALRDGGWASFVGRSYREETMERIEQEASRFPLGAIVELRGDEFHVRKSPRALILYPDGTSKEVQPANGDQFTLEELQQIVGGHIECIPLPDGRIMTLNEDGRPDEEAGIEGLPRNEQATALVGFPSDEGPVALIRELGIDPRYLYVGPIEPVGIYGTVLVSTPHEVGWME